MDNLNMPRQEPEVNLGLPEDEAISRDGADRNSQDSNAAREYTLTLFRDEYAQDKTRWEGTLAQIAQNILATVAADKADLPWLKFALFGNERTARGNSYRSNANVKWITGVEADYDGGKVTFDEAVAIVRKAGIVAMLYTTPSNTDAAPRWRVCCPTSKRLPTGERVGLMDRLNGIFGGAFATESWTLSQSYYFGGIAGKPAVRVEVVPGDHIDLRPELPAIPKPSGGPAETRGHPDAEPNPGVPISVERLRAMGPAEPNPGVPISVEQLRAMGPAAAAACADLGYPRLRGAIWSVKRTPVDGDDDFAIREEVGRAIYEANHIWGGGEDETFERLWDTPPPSTGAVIGPGTFVYYARLGGWRPDPNETFKDCRDMQPANDEPEPDTNAVTTQAGSEDWFALRFARGEGARLRYVNDWGRWKGFDGQRWVDRSTPDVWNRIRPLVRTVAMGLEKERDRINLLSRTKVAGIEGFARGDLSRGTDGWDADPWVLNTPGGTVDLRTGTLRPAVAGDYCTKMTTATPGGECPLFLKFIGEVTGGDVELQRYLQRLAGYALIGKVLDHVLVFLYGTGNNGKGVFLGTLGTIMADYAQVAPIALFTEKRNEQHPTAIARLQGARLVQSQETEEGRAWDETLIKTLTGGDRLTGRYMRQDFFEFEPQHTLMIAGNHKPRLRNVDEAARRRIHMVPFNVTIPKAQRDEKLRDKLAAEHGGVLQWMVEGCLEYQRIGLAPPAAVVTMTAEYFDEQDPLADWLVDEGWERDPTMTAFTSLAVLYANYEGHTRAAGSTPGTRDWFSAKLESHGFKPVKRKTGKGFLGITVTF